MTDKPNLYVVDAKPPPETPRQAVKRRVRNRPRPEHMMQCYECGGREGIEAKSGVMSKDGKPAGGTKQLLCVVCLTQGKRSVMF